MSTANSLNGLPFPQSLPDFTRMFPTDEACALYLEQVRWPAGFICPHCRGTTSRRTSTSSRSASIGASTARTLPMWSRSLNGCQPDKHGTNRR